MELERPDQEQDRDPADESTPRRATTLALVGVIAIAFVGFFAGTVGSKARPTAPDRAVAPRPIAPVSSVADVHRAVTYEEMGRMDIGPNRDWSTRLADLKQPEIDLFAEVVVTPESKLASLAERATRRAYNGAPPVIPHAVDQVSVESCLGCHESGLAVGDRSASRIPHPFLTSCTQCHVEQRSRDLPPFELAANTFAGLPAPFEGSRASPGAPPVIPHSTLMRTDCLSCHGPLGAEGMRTTHAWRQSCTQCHAPSAVLDQYASSEEVPLLPGPVVRSE